MQRKSGLCFLKVFAISASDKNNPGFPFFNFFWRLAYDNKLSSATSIHVNSCKRRCISVAFSVTRKATAGNTSAFVRGCSHFMGNSNNNSFITIEVAKIILTSGNFNVIESVEIEPKIEKQDQRHLQ